MVLYVVYLVCASSIPLDSCDVRTARVVNAYRAPAGIILCGLPGLLPASGSIAAADNTEYYRLRCMLR